MYGVWPKSIQLFKIPTDDVEYTENIENTDNIEHTRNAEINNTILFHASQNSLRTYEILKKINNLNRLLPL